MYFLRGEVGNDLGKIIVMSYIGKQRLGFIHSPLSNCNVIKINGEIQLPIYFYKTIFLRDNSGYVGVKKVSLFIFHGHRDNLCSKVLHVSKSYSSILFPVPRLSP